MQVISFAGQSIPKQGFSAYSSSAAKKGSKPKGGVQMKSPLAADVFQKSNSSQPKK